MYEANSINNNLNDSYGNPLVSWGKGNEDEGSVLTVLEGGEM
jgi:hypothetical protein